MKNSILKYLFPDFDTYKALVIGNRIVDFLSLPTHRYSSGLEYFHLDDCTPRFWYNNLY